MSDPKQTDDQVEPTPVETEPAERPEGELSENELEDVSGGGSYLWRNRGW